MGCRFVELFQGHLTRNNEYDQQGNPLATDVIREVNEGSPLLLYAGHANEVSLSTSNFSNYHVNSLNNKDKYFLGCIVGCSLGHTMKKI